MAEIATEDDLWTLFWKTPPKNGHKKKGEEFLYCDDLLQILNAKSFGEDGKSKLALNDENRRYLISNHTSDAFVRQCDLRDVGKAMMRESGDVHVGYLGTAEVQDRVAPGNNSEATQRESGVQKAAVGDRKKVSKPKANDSIDKIVTSYFTTLTAEPFQYKGKEYLPRDVHVSPGIVRGYTCPPMCGGCCPRFSLDYIAPDGVPIVGDKHPLTPRMVEFNGREVEVWSDMQSDHKNAKCRNLNLDDGRCGIHGNQPFSCDFELLRSIIHQKKAPRVDFTQKLYGRGWAMMRVDGDRGVLCEMTPADPDTIADVDRRLARLGTWMKHFGLNPVRVEKIRAALPEIAKTGQAFLITESD